MVKEKKCSGPPCLCCGANFDLNTHWFHFYKNYIFIPLGHCSYNLVTDQINIYSSWGSSPSFLSIDFKIAFTFTSPFPYTIPSHNSIQLSGEWQDICRPLCVGRISSTGRISLIGRISLTGSAIWLPKIREPGWGESRPAKTLASSDCPSKSKRWKKEDACMADTRPCSGFKLVKDARLTLGSSFCWDWEAGGTFCKMIGSNTSPAMKGTGNDSGVDLNNSWPRSQNAVVVVFIIIRFLKCSNGYLHWRRSDAITPDIGNPSAITFLASFPTVKLRASDTGYWNDW